MVDYFSELFLLAVALKYQLVPALPITRFVLFLTKQVTAIAFDVVGYGVKIYEKYGLDPTGQSTAWSNVSTDIALCVGVVAGLLMVGDMTNRGLGVTRRDRARRVQQREFVL